MEDKIHIPARTKAPVVKEERCVIRLSAEAYNALVDIYNESTLSMKDIASLIITQSVDRVVFDKEE